MKMCIQQALWIDYCFRSRLACAYQVAKRHVLAAGFEREVKLQAEKSLEAISEQDFLREAAWVILSSGMRESVVRNLFPRFEAAFLQFRSASLIISKRRICRRRGLECFNHLGKIDAVLNVAKHVANQGFESVINSLRTDPVDYLLQFPYLGPATSRHLAKNLGAKIAKPDRHLKRVSACFGFSSPDLMCSAIASIVPDDISVIDLVIWRFATLDKNYLDFFSLASTKTLKQTVTPSRPWRLKSPESISRLSHYLFNLS